MAETYADLDSRYRNIEYQQQQQTAELMAQYGLISQLPNPEAALNLSFFLVEQTLAS